MLPSFKRHQGPAQIHVAFKPPAPSPPEAHPRSISGSPTCCPYHHRTMLGLSVPTLIRTLTLWWFPRVLQEPGLPIFSLLTKQPSGASSSAQQQKPLKTNLSQKSGSGFTGRRLGMGGFLGVSKSRTANPLWASQTHQGGPASRAAGLSPSLDSGLWLTLLVTFLGSTRWQGSYPRLSRCRSIRTRWALLLRCSDKALGLVLVEPHRVARVTWVAQESAVLVCLVSWSHSHPI